MPFKVGLQPTAQKKLSKSKEMSFTLEDALTIIDDTPPDLLRSLPIELIQQISQLLSPDEFKEFLFAKNVKIFGGINQYVDDFFKKMRMNSQSGPVKVGLLQTLKKMQTYELSPENKQRVEDAILRLESFTAPAAGGRRKTKSRTRRRRARTRK